MVQKLLQSFICECTKIMSLPRDGSKTFKQERNVLTSLSSAAEISELKNGAGASFRQVTDLVDAGARKAVVGAIMTSERSVLENFMMYRY